MTGAPRGGVIAGALFRGTRAGRWWSAPFMAILVLATVIGGAPPAAEARDLLILLRGEMRHGELSGCDATACRLDKATVPRSDIVFIGLGDPPLPLPTIQNFLQDELHLPDGSIRPGPLVSIDARQVVTPARTYARREIRWIHLARPPARSAGGGGMPHGSGSDRGDGAGTCGFWVGMVGRRGVSRHADSGTVGVRSISTTRTVYTVRLREAPRSGNLGLHLDDATVREHFRQVVWDQAGVGNRTAGSGTSHIEGATSDGLLALAGPSGPGHYRFNVGTAEYRYPETTHWASGPPTHGQRLFEGIWVGKDPDPEQPRLLDASGRIMKGQYAITNEYGEHDRLTEAVSWDLVRVTAPCDAPPTLPPLPAEGDAADGDPSEGDKP